MCLKIRMRRSMHFVSAFRPKQDMTPEHVIPFSSDRKYSGAVFEERGTYLMGAAQFLFPEDNEELTEKCQAYAEEGLRVLVLAHSSQNAEGTELPEGSGTAGSDAS